MGRFPSVHLDDAQGKPMRRWRVLILPLMEQSALYNAYNFSEPWDGPSNRRLISVRPAIYACPLRDPPRNRPPAQTNRSSKTARQSPVRNTR